MDIDRHDGSLIASLYLVSIIAPLLTASRWPLFLRVLGLIVLCIGIMIPWWLQLDSLRALYSMTTYTWFLRTIQMLLEDADFIHRPLWYRIAFIHVYHDIRRVYSLREANIKKLNRACELIAQTVFSIGPIVISGFLRNLWLSYSSVMLTMMDPSTLIWMNYFIRVLTGSIQFQASIFLIDSIYRIMIVFCGYDAPINMYHPLHSLSPMRATTVRQFWSRWNKSIQRLLASLFYKPIFRLKLFETSVAHVIGVMLCFVGSGVQHAYPVYVVLGMKSIMTPVYCSFLFFAIQPLLIFIESTCGLSGHIWVYSVLLPLVPMFIDGFMQTLGM